MIKSINPQGKYLQVTGGQASNYVNNYSGAQGVGNVRFNTTSQTMEVYDGNNWIQLQMSHATVGLNYEAESLLDWAARKRNEEQEFERLAKDNAAVRIAMENVEKAKQQLRITATLAKDTAHDFGEAVMEQASP